jgi:hypothetical protein
VFFVSLHAAMKAAQAAKKQQKAGPVKGKKK